MSHRYRVYDKRETRNALFCSCPVAESPELFHPQGLLIGPKGDTIRRIEADTGARLILKEDAKEMLIYAPTRHQYDQAETAILDVQGANIREGEVYDVKVVSLSDFGAFVELPNGFQALLHISELTHNRIRAIEDVLYEGQDLKVKCLGRDPKGNVKLSRKALLPKPKPRGQ